MNIQTPFGGKKASGIGREFGEYVGHWLARLTLVATNPELSQALRAFTEPKTILIK